MNSLLQRVATLPAFAFFEISKLVRKLRAFMAKISSVTITAFASAKLVKDGVQGHSPKTKRTRPKVIKKNDIVFEKPISG